MSMNFPKGLSAVAVDRATAFPLDANAYFESLSAAQAAALTAEEVGSKLSAYYYGQTISVVENNVATLYIIDKESYVEEEVTKYRGTLKRVGGLADGRSLNLDAATGTMSIKNYGVEYYEWDSTNKTYKASPTTGWKADLTPRVKDIGTSGSPNYVIAWYEPNGITVEGLEIRIAALESSVGDLQTLSSDHEGRLDTLESLHAKKDATTFYTVAEEVTSGINTLDVTVKDGESSNLNAGKTLATLTETDGKIAATFQNIAITASQVTDYATAWTTEMDKIKGKASGVAELDANSKVPLAQLPDAILGQLLFGGTFASTAVATISTNLKTKLNISDNTITLVNSATDDKTKTPKEYGYKTLEGVYFIATGFESETTIFGEVFNNGDWLISTGAGWKKIDNTDAVISVNGKTGAVVLTATDVGLGAVANTGDSAAPVEGGTTKFTTGGAYTELAKKVDKTTTIAGVDLQDNITAAELRTGLNVSDGANKVEATAKSGNISIDGTSVQIIPDNVVTDANYKHITVSATDGVTAGSGAEAVTYKYDDTALAGRVTTLESGKADKVTGTFTANNFAALDANGNIKDSGKKDSDYATAAQGAKADTAIQGVKVGTTELTVDTDKKVTIPAAVASTSGAGGTNGYMSATDKEKIDKLDDTYKKVQFAVTDPTATGDLSLTFIDTISQDTQGVITATKKEINLSSKQDTLAFEGTYNASTNKVATQSTVKDAVDALDVTVTGMGAGKTIKTLTETDGKIAATFEDIAITASQITDGTTTFKTRQTTVDSGAAASNTFVSRVEQNANGEVTITKGTVDLSSKQDAFTDGTATVATVSDGVVTIKNTVEQENGQIKTDSTAADDIKLAKVATTGSAADVDVDATTTVSAALSNLSTAISAEETRATGAESGLSDRIDNLEARGRFLSSWNSASGLPTTRPTIPEGASYPYVYTYKSGDYYIVESIDNASQYTEYSTTTQYAVGDKVRRTSSTDVAFYICKETTTGDFDSTKWTAHNITNYQPSGTSIQKTSAEAADWTIGKADESREVGIGDYYTFDGSKWILVSNSQKTVTFQSIAGDARDNTSLNTEFSAIDTALDNKVDKNGTDRLMTADEGTKLAGIAAGAQVNVLESVKIGTSALTITDKAVTLPAATASALGLVKVDDDTVAVDANGKISVKGVYIGQDASGNDLYVQKGDTITINGGTAN